MDESLSLPTLFPSPSLDTTISSPPQTQSLVDLPSPFKASLSSGTPSTNSATLRFREEDWFQDYELPLQQDEDSYDHALTVAIWKSQVLRTDSYRRYCMQIIRGLLRNASGAPAPSSSFKDQLEVALEIATSIVFDDAAQHDMMLQLSALPGFDPMFVPLKHFHSTENISLPSKKTFKILKQKAETSAYVFPLRIHRLSLQLESECWSCSVEPATVGLVENNRFAAAFQEFCVSSFPGKKITTQACGVFRRGAKLASMGDIIVSVDDPSVSLACLAQHAQDAGLIRCVNLWLSSQRCIAQTEFFSVDIKCFSESSFYPELVYFTGSREHLEAALDLPWSSCRQALQQATDCHTEGDVLGYFGLEYTPPCLRI